jgi:hypothetical protein
MIGQGGTVSKLPALLSVCAALILGACGSTSARGSSSSSSGPSTSATPSSSSATASAAARGSASGSLATQSPDTILAESAAALRGAHGFRLRGVIVEQGERLQLAFTTSGSGALKLSYGSSGEALQIITLPTGAYLRANRSFWTRHAGPRAANLADRWLQVPVASTRSLTASLGALAPATVARCLVEDHGTLTKSGPVKVYGRKAILLKDAGNVPGSAPGVLAVAATGKPYPLRFLGVGHQRPGGRIDVCNDGKGGQNRGLLSFSGFNAVAPIQPPAHALQLKSGLISA